MRLALVAVAGAALLAVAAARCPNSCSGHGDCGIYDKCTCWANWQGADCSERTCEYDIAWATDYRQDAHYYAECSAKGLCDRSTGLCVCFEGYSGSACKRSVCPNDCSGHGKCRLIQDLVEANTQQAPIQTVSPLADAAAGNSHTSRPSAKWNIDGTFLPNTNGLAWDNDKIQACVCDGEFFGPDCSQRYCPKGDDPLTTCAELSAVNTISTTYGNKQQVQRLTLSSTAGTLNNPSVTFSASWTGDLVLHFIDNHGEVWTTQRISTMFATSAATLAGKIRVALMAIPNYKIPSVKVDAVGGFGDALSGSTNTIAFDVTFDNERNSGNQQLLACDPQPLGCQSVGCSPKYQQPLFVMGDKADIVGNLAAAVVADPLNPTTGVFSPDSILDTSDPLFTNGFDAAEVTVTFADADAHAAPGDLYYQSYTAEWKVNNQAIIGEPYSAAMTTTLGKPAYVPVGTYATIGGSGALGVLTPATGLGIQRIPLGFGMYLNRGPATTANDLDLIHTYTIQTIRCAVAETQRADLRYEDLQCSGRGTCDHSTGNCACFEGHYGDHCGLQTILV